MTKLERTFSRDPSDYRRTTHSLYREKRDRKVLNGDMISDAIEEGSVVKTDENHGGTDEALTLEHQWLQTTLRVVICPKDGVIQSAWEVTP